MFLETAVNQTGDFPSRPAQPNATSGKRFTRRNFKHSPLLVFYEVTQACDLVCTHCRACAQPRRHPGELSTALSLRLIDQLAEFPSPPMLVFTGGDPLKRDDIFALIERAAQRGLEASITPSATPLVTPAAIRRLRAAGAARMAISIDGPDAASHDAVRKVAGSFDRSLRILEQARSEGFSTQVNTTLTPQNVGQIEQMAALMARLETAMWSVFFLVPVGRGSSVPRLSAAECEQAFAALWRESRRRPFLIKSTEAPHYRRYVIQHQASKSDRPDDSLASAFVPLGVNDGNGVMFISHVGMIHPSGFLPIVCGLFPLTNVVQAYQRSPVFCALRCADRLEGKCRSCEFRNICAGSRARAYAVSGNPFAAEPDCAYVPPALLNS
jgi:radical SAM protein